MKVNNRVVRTRGNNGGAESLIAFAVIIVVAGSFLWGVKSASIQWENRDNLIVEVDEPDDASGLNGLYRLVSVDKTITYPNSYSSTAPITSESK